MSFNHFDNAEKVTALEHALLSLRDETDPDPQDFRYDYRVLIGAYHREPALIDPLSVCVFVDNLAARNPHLALTTADFMARLAGHDDTCDALISQQLIPQMRKFVTPPYDHSKQAITSAAINLFSDHPEQFRALCEGYFRKLANPADPFFHPETALSRLGSMSQNKNECRIDGFLANDIVEQFIALAPNRDAGISASRAGRIRKMALQTDDMITRRAPDWLKIEPERPKTSPTDAVAAWIKQHG